MSQYTDSPLGTFRVAAALGQFLRVKHSAAGVVALAGATDTALGVTQKATFAANEPVAIRYANAFGTQIMIASGAIPAGADVFAAAAGKVAATGFLRVGIAKTAATADGDQLEVLTLPTPTDSGAAASVAAAGSAQGDAGALTGRVNTVSAADGTKGVVLPAAVPGLVVEVYNEHATNGLKVYPASGDDINDGSSNAAVTIEGKSLALFRALDATTWAAQFTANS